MADLIATKSLKYATRRLMPDDHFTTKSDRDARILVGTGKARHAEKKPAKPDELTELRAEYTNKLGKKPFYGWDVATLREKIADAST